MKQISVIFIFLLSIYSTVWATDPQVRSFATQDDYEKGESKGISITSTGFFQLAPQIEEICDTKEPFIWDFVVNNQGKIFFCAGTEGKIFTLDNSKNPSLFCQFDEIEIYTLTFDNRQTLYAATSPDGKIYRISATGTPHIFYDPPDKYIWDLIFDKANNLYVATGDSGKIYKIDPTGNAKLFFDSKEIHIRCLAWDLQGNLLAGSYENGYLYRIDNSGAAFVIYDSDLKEIHQIEVGKDGTIYAAALGQSQRIMPMKPQQKTPKGEQDESIIIEEDGEETVIIGEIQIEAPQPQKPGTRTTESAIYKIMPNGLIRNTWDDYKEPVQSMILDKKGQLIVGTGKTGKLFKIISPDEKIALTGLDESQISVFFENNKGEILFATSNMGKLFKIAPKYRQSGNYLSEVLDSYTTSKWGSINWTGEYLQNGSIKFYTRSGNTEEPNDTWSRWSSAYTNQDGSNITNPDSRFLQWKLELNTSDNQKSPKVKNISVSYMQMNLPPEIASITIYPQGEYYQNSDTDFDSKSSFFQEENEFGGSGNQPPNNRNHYLGRKIFRQSFRTVSWLVIDDNNDNLIFNLLYREQSEKKWKTLVKNWQSRSFAWDTERMPDGIYFVKLQASDSLSNPPDIFLSSERISESFTVDNTGPDVLKPEIKKITGQWHINFTVKDLYNPVKEVQYAINGEDWKPIYSIDSIIDSKIEQFLIKAPSSLGKGKHSLVIKAMDSLKNITYLRTYFED